MWHAKIVRLLLNKINKNESDEAYDFYKTFFARIKEFLFSSENDPHFELALGTVEKLFNKFAGRDDHSVSLEDFSRYLLGLTLCYAKIDSDGKVWNKNFSFLLKNKTVLSALGLQKTIDNNVEDLEQNRREYITHKGDQHKKPSIKTQARILALNDLELMVLSDLQFDTRVDFDKLVTVFDKVESWPVMSSFFAEAARTIDIGSKLADFLFIVYYHSGMKRGMSTELEIYERYFFMNMIDFKVLLTEYESNQEIHLQLCKFSVALIIANYAYLIQPNCHSYSRFKTTVIEAIAELPSCFDKDPKVLTLINKIIFSVLNIGQFQPIMNNDKFPLTEEEHNFILILNKFYKYFEENCDEYQKVAEELFVYLSDNFVYYLRNKTTINYFVFKSCAIDAIKRVKQLVEENSARKLLEQLEFSLLGMGIRYPLYVKQCQSVAEQKFAKFVGELGRKIATAKATEIQRDQYKNSDLPVMEALVSELEVCIEEYIFSNHSFLQFKAFVANVSAVIETVKPEAATYWTGSISTLERLMTNLRLSWGTKPSAAEFQTTRQVVVSSEEKYFLTLVEEFSTFSSDYVDREVLSEKCDPDVGLIDALVSQLDTATAIYLQYRTPANFRTFKMIFEETIADYQPKLSLYFKLKLNELLISLAEIPMPISHFEEGQRHSIFSQNASQTPNEDSSFVNRAFANLEHY